MSKGWGGEMMEVGEHFLKRGGLRRRQDLIVSGR